MKNSSFRRATTFSTTIKNEALSKHNHTKRNTLYKIVLSVAIKSIMLIFL
jgi:hypothetical protein